MSTTKVGAAIFGISVSLASRTLFRVTVGVPGMVITGMDAELEELEDWGLTGVSKATGD